jgi:GNAT superfamily N-acetyltransferase
MLDDPVIVEVVRTPTASLESLFQRALDEATNQRGGALLTETVLAGRTTRQVLAEAVKLGSLVGARNGEVTVGFALVSHGVVIVVFVDRDFRRQGVARRILNAVIGSHRDVLDAYALPGDRATKSLYESFGWKARLLTMRAE